MKSLAAFGRWQPVTPLLSRLFQRLLSGEPAFRRFRENVSRIYLNCRK